MSIATITTYALLLIAMLAGLMRQRQARSFGIWNMLHQQGWIWFALAVVAEAPPLILVLLNIDPSLNFMLQVPRVVIASIGTTVMFRMLHNYSGQRDSALPTNALRLTPDQSAISISSSQPLNDLKISVRTSTVRF